MDDAEERRSARAYLDGREMVSDTQYECEVLSAGRGFAWAKLIDSLGEDVPDTVLQQLKEMTAGVKRKAKMRSRRSLFDASVEYVVYVGALDLLDQGTALRTGQKVKLKLYTDSKGVGGCDVHVLEEPPESSVEKNAEPVPVGETNTAEDTPKVAGLLKVGLVTNGEEPRALSPEPKERKPRYMKHFVAKVAEEDRQVLEGWYEGEVVQRSKTYAWIKPLDPSTIPEDVQVKLQEMCDGFRKKAEDGQRRPFCGGIEENVVYVANPDLTSKGTILSVGMKVKFKLYTDNKGVGGYEVLPSEEHIQKMLDTIRSNFENEEGKQKTLQLSSVFGEGPDRFKDVLWIGECTHAFSLAAGRLCGVMPFAGETDHAHSLEGKASWCSTELQWPRQLERNLELQLAENLKLLRSKGAWCSDGIDAHRLKTTLERAKSPCSSFDTVFWMMPYVSDRQWRPPSSIAIMMHYYISAFVQNAVSVCKEDGQVVVVVTSAQCLTWNLYNCKPEWNGKTVVPEVWWFDVSKFEKHGYQSRFGDGRDRYVDQPVFHRLCDMVAVCWRMDYEAPPETEEGAAENVTPGVTEEDIAARKKLLEEVGKEKTEAPQEAALA